MLQTSTNLIVLHPKHTTQGADGVALRGLTKEAKGTCVGALVHPSPPFSWNEVLQVHLKE